MLFRSIYAGATTSFATATLTGEDGTIGYVAYAWGENANGQLGDASYANKSVAMVNAYMAQEDVQRRVRFIAGGEDHTVMIRNDGYVLTTGSNHEGQLGLSAEVSGVSIPTMVAVGGVGDTAVGALQMKVNGTQATDINTTVTITNKDETVTISDILVNTNGTVDMSRAINVFTNAADTTITGGDAKITVTTDSWLVEIVKESETSYTVVPLADAVGTAVVTVTDQTSGAFKQVTIVIQPHDGQENAGADVENYTFTQPMLVSGDGFTLALKANGTVWAWGDNVYGQLGIGTVGNQVMVPVQVQTEDSYRNHYFLYNIVHIAAGANHALAVDVDGNIYAWGQNDNSSESNRPFLSDLAGGNYPYATHIRNMGVNARVYAGGNQSWILADNNKAYSYSLRQVDVDIEGKPIYKYTWDVAYNDVKDMSVSRDGSTVATLTTAGAIGGSVTGFGTDVVYTAVAAGTGFVVALGADGKVYTKAGSAAAASNGQLGQGRGAVSTSVGTVKRDDMTELTNVKYIAAGTAHALAVTEEGKIYVWGRNNNGQLGDGTLYDSFTAQERTNVPSAYTGTAAMEHTPETAKGVISAGTDFSVFLTASGAMYATGTNTTYQVGSGESTQRDRKSVV